jgi:hypothetical protein
VVEIWWGRQKKKRKKKVMIYDKMEVAKER